MKILSNQSFWDKLLNFGMLLLIIKLISILLSFFYLPAGEVFISLLLFLLAAFVILMAISFLKDSKFSPNSGGRSSGRGSLGSGGSAFVGIELFNKIYRKYEEAAEKYIEQKEYKKAANIYLRLLQNPHQALRPGQDWPISRPVFAAGVWQVFPTPRQWQTCWRPAACARPA